MVEPPPSWTLQVVENYHNALRLISLTFWTDKDGYERVHDCQVMQSAGSRSVWALAIALWYQYTILPAP